MQNPFAVSLQYGELIALVTYHYPKPFFISPQYAGRDTIYTIQHEGEELEFDSREKILMWLEKSIAHIAIPAAISNIEFLSAQYEPKALKIYGSDLKAIEAELAKVPPGKFDTAEDLLFLCTPNYDY